MLCIIAVPLAEGYYKYLSIIGWAINKLADGIERISTYIAIWNAISRLAFTVCDPIYSRQTGCWCPGSLCRHGYERQPIGQCLP